MAIKITNYLDQEAINLSLPLIIGELASERDSIILVQNLTTDVEPLFWPVICGKFKVIVQLIPGTNLIHFKHKNVSHSLTLIYQPMQNRRFVRLVYIKCQDDSGRFQAPIGENNSVQSACKRLSLAAKMLQTFTSDKIKEHNLNRKTFRLEEENNEVICHVFKSSLTLSEAHKLNEEQLWCHFAVELMNSSLRVGNNCKFLAFLSFTRFNNNGTFPPLNHKQVLQMTKGQVALGGGGLALFGTGCLHTWPENVQQIPWRFGDKRKIDRMILMDDSANRGWYWACYSTGLGSTLHELGHTFDLGHTTGGIMGRGFDDIHKHFIIDMFYIDHVFQKEHNPFYQTSSIQNHTVPLSVTSPLSWETNLNSSLLNIQLESQKEHATLEKPTKNKVTSEKPWGIPNPPDVLTEDKLAVHVGGAYWTRSSALLLYFHKWFNGIDLNEGSAISMDGFHISSPNGIQIIEFRDGEGTSIHHLEFLGNEENAVVDLKEFNLLHNFSNDVKDVSFIAEDSAGNLLKSKLDLKQLYEAKN